MLIKTEPFVEHTQAFTKPIHLLENPKKARDLKRKGELSLSKALDISRCIHREPPLAVEWRF